MIPDTGHWTLAEGLEYSPDRFGFIYLITNTVTNQRYIGKKQCLSKVRRKPLKGHKRARLGFKESDWKSYTSSSKELNEDIQKYGKDKFAFVIIEWCDSKWELAYHEARIQFERNVLFESNYYNGILNLRIRRAPRGARRR